MKINPICQTVYKVLYFNPSSNALDSITIQVRASIYNIRYSADGTLTRPKVGRIFAFASLSAAEKFAGDCICEYGKDRVQVWECEGYGAKWLTIRLALSDLDASHWVNTFWNKLRQKLSGKIKQGWANMSYEFSCLSTPTDTLACSSIRLKKKLV